jgi:hypothetical protein
MGSSVRRRSVGILLGSVLALGCAHYALDVREDERLSPGSAYLYGHFIIDVSEGEAQPEAPRWYQSMGLVMRCDDGATYPIRFLKKTRVQVIKISPSRCALDEVVYTDQNDRVLQRSPPPAAWVRHEDFAAGRGYYLGDYVAVGHYKAEPTGMRLGLLGPGIPHETWDWKMDWAFDDEYNYDETTAKMKRTYANLAPLPTEDRRLVPRQHAPGVGAGRVEARATRP